MFREAITAQEVGTGMKKSHHLTASLYFGIALSRSFEVRGEAERKRNWRLVGYSSCLSLRKTRESTD
jgi:hypothetical protein